MSSRTLAGPNRGRVTSIRNIVTAFLLPYRNNLQLHQAGSMTCQISEIHDIFSSILRTYAVPGTHTALQLTAIPLALHSGW
ncbi:MAG: hypothetical protein JRH18_23430 [Deltaproteobacteria bacterium]|nr:hypothetical protein [Deltaproteobacteria bacterium]MBW2154598.1 hypothetical protein [Deltaproteobacteria bacterium]